MRRSIVWFANLGFATLLCSCAGSENKALPVENDTSTQRTVTARLRIAIPAKPHHRKGRQPRYLSPATQGLTLSLTGPNGFKLDETVGLTVTNDPQACKSSLAGTTCMLEIPGLKPCPGSKNCYTITIATYDAISGCPKACSVTGANELSANQGFSFAVSPGQDNTIAVTLDGIPTAVALLPAPGSSLSGNTDSGFVLSKCGSDKIEVLGLDADGNVIVGAGAPTPALTSNSKSLVVKKPADSAPNTFTLVRPSPPPDAGATVHLSAVVKPLASSGAKPVQNTSISMTFNNDICGVFTEFPLPNGSAPSGITGAPRALRAPIWVWFTESGTDKVGSIDWGDGHTSQITDYSLPSGSRPMGIAFGSDGNPWFAETGTSSIARILTVTGKSSGRMTPTADSGPMGVTAGPGGNVWFTEHDANQIASANAEGAGGIVIAEYSIPTAGSGPQGITTGPDGALWFTECLGNKIGRMTTGGMTNEYMIPTKSSHPMGITTGPDDALWFTEFMGNKIGRITTDGKISEYTLDWKNSGPVSLIPAVQALREARSGRLPTKNGSGAGSVQPAATPDFYLVFTMSNNNAIGRITTDGVVTEYSIPTKDSGATGITVTSDGSIWFTEMSKNKIGLLR